MVRGGILFQGMTMSPDRAPERSPEPIVISELTYGKLYSDTRDAPEDLHVTSRSPELANATVEALQLSALLDGAELVSSRIDSQCAAAGAFLIRPLQGASGLTDKIGLVRVRLRDHISPSGARRLHPQMIASIVGLNDFLRRPKEIIDEAKTKAANRVSMDLEPAERNKPAYPLRIALKSPGAGLAEERFQQLAPLLDVLFPPEAGPAERNRTHVFGPQDFADEAEFLADLGAALAQGPDRALLARLTVSVGLDVPFSGAVIKYLPSSKAGARRLSSAQMQDLRARLEPRRSFGVSRWSRAAAPAGQRSIEIVDRAARWQPAANRAAQGGGLPLARAPSERAIAAGPAKLTPQQAASLFRTACWRYRNRPDKASAARELDKAAHMAGADDPAVYDELDVWDAQAFRSLRCYLDAPSAQAPLGQLVDGALFHYDRTRDRKPDSLSQAWSDALDEKLLAIDSFTKAELDALLGRRLHEALTDRTWDRLNNLTPSEPVERWTRAAARAREASASSLGGGLNGLYYVHVNALVPFAKPPTLI
jgi:hypothetical protein